MKIFRDFRIHGTGSCTSRPCPHHPDVTLHRRTLWMPIREFPAEGKPYLACQPMALLRCPQCGVDFVDVTLSSDAAAASMFNNVLVPRRLRRTP